METFLELKRKIFTLDAGIELDEYIHTSMILWKARPQIWWARFFNRALFSSVEPPTKSCTVKTLSAVGV